MSTDETLRQWKDPEFRGDTFEHPAGDIDLTGAGVDAAPLTMTWSANCTIHFSCFGCDETLGGGSCLVYTAGCCRGDDEMR